MIGATIYHDLDLSERTELLEEILRSVASVTGEQRLNYFTGMFTDTDRFSREKKLTEKNLQQLKVDLGGGVYQDLAFNELPGAAREQNEEGVSLHIGMIPAFQRGERAVYPYEVHLLVPDEVAQSTDAVSQGVLRFAADLQSPYALVYGGPDFGDVYMELTATPMFPWGKQLTEQEERRRERLLHWQGERVRIGEVVRGAYWGNLLGADMVKHLGGPDRVRSEAPVERVQELSNGGVYLQLTNDPADWRRAEYPFLLEKLESYLAPVSLQAELQADR